LHDTFRDIEGVVVRKRDRAGAQSQKSRLLGHGGEEDLRRRNGFPTARMMLAYPRLVIAELIRDPEQFEVTLHAERDVSLQRMERWQEDTVSHCQPSHLCSVKNVPSFRTL